MIDRSNHARLLPESELGRQALQRQQGYRLDDISTENWLLDVCCSEVAQRNWSRVATGLNKDQEGVGQRRFFLKQYVDRAGHWHENLWAYDRSGACVAHEILSKHVGIPQLVASDWSLLVNAFEYADILSMDELLRRNTGARGHFGEQV